MLFPHGHSQPRIGRDPLTMDGEHAFEPPNKLRVRRGKCRDPGIVHRTLPVHGVPLEELCVS
jgi:hypothetical protein